MHRWAWERRACTKKAWEACINGKGVGEARIQGGVGEPWFLPNLTKEAP